MPYVKLQGSDGVVFNVDVEVAKVCGTLKIRLEDLRTDGEEGEVVVLPEVKTETLAKVIEWATYHKDVPPITENYEPLNEEMSTWDRHFLDVDTSTIFDLMLAANYLDLPSLMDAAAKIIANMMKGKTPAEIRAIFNIMNDFPDGNQEEYAAKKRKISSDAE